MRLKLNINRHTTASELIHLSGFFGALALNRGGAVVSETPIDPAELDEGEEVVTLRVPVANDTHSSGADFDKPKRRRRTKAEIEAADRAGEVVENNPPAVAPEPEAGNEQAVTPTEPEQAPAAEAPAPIQPAPETTSGAVETPASASPSEGGKTYTHAEVQALAVDTARRYGPEKVKALIATYPNAAKIAELDEGDLAGFVAKLQAISA